MIICGSEKLLRQFMMMAKDEGMTEGDYVYITPSLLPVDNWATRWHWGDSHDQTARLAFGPLLQVRMSKVYKYRLLHKYTSIRVL